LQDIQAAIAETEPLPLTATAEVKNSNVDQVLSLLQLQPECLPLAEAIAGDMMQFFCQPGSRYR